MSRCSELQALQPHFACVIRRMAKHQESRLVDSSLRHFMSSLPDSHTDLGLEPEGDALQFLC